MSAASERMTRLSLESLKVVEGLNPDIEEDAMEEIDCGEWDGAIMDALDLAHDRKDLWPKFPEEVKAMTRDPEWPDLHRLRPGRKTLEHAPVFRRCRRRRRRGRQRNRLPAQPLCPARRAG